MFRPRPSRWYLSLAAILLPLTPVYAASNHWRYDTVHSQVLFSVGHNGYSYPFGRLHIARGWLQFDPDDWNNAATELDIDLASVDMGDSAWNKAVCRPALLDCARHRYAHFASISVERTDAHRGVLHGQLSLRGITSPLDLPFTFNRAAMTIFGLHTIAGFSATATLDRTSFGITAYPGSIGKQVTVTLELEAIRDQGAASGSKESP
jgi:polyisoprenoid-binding protein YceI